MENNNKKRILLMIGIILLVILIVGAAYAYFQMTATNNAEGTRIIGEGDSIGQVILETNIEELKLRLDFDMMSEENAGQVYYATENGNEVVEPSLGNGIYTLATASVVYTDEIFNCRYVYDLKATASKTIGDNSDLNYKVVITEVDGTKTVYTLRELLQGVTHEGNIIELSSASSKELRIEAYIENTNVSQDDLQGIEYTLSIKAKNGEEGFSCDEYKPTFAEKLINSGDLWSSGLEGDGLRYVGSGAYNGDTTPSNFICFGTTSASECKANEEKYMYRIIGIFPDENGTQHLKLKKFKQLGKKKWNDTAADVNWGESTLYTYLNGTGFLGNTTYSYLQDDSWSNKIENWKWTAVNTLTNSNSGPNYFSGSTMTPANIYLHEMNRSTKTSTVGEWTYPEGKIGLMYVSDYVLSLGNEALTITGSTSNNAAKLITGWLHYTNDGNSASAYEWTIARRGAYSSAFRAWSVTSMGDVTSYDVTYVNGAAPVFYLTSDVTLSSGTGAYTDPYIIG